MFQDGTTGSKGTTGSNGMIPIIILTGPMILLGFMSYGTTGLISLSALNNASTGPNDTIYCGSNDTVQVWVQ